MRNDIMDSLATNERAFCDISVYFNLHQTKQDFLVIYTYFAYTVALIILAVISLTTPWKKRNI